MKKLIPLSLLLLMSSSFVFSQTKKMLKSTQAFKKMMATEPIDKKRCYETVIISPDQYETITEQILIKEPSERLEVIPAQFEIVSPEKVLIKEGTDKGPVDYETITGQVLLKHAYTVLGVLPAVYVTAEEDILIKEATPTEPAVYKKIKRQLLQTPPTTYEKKIPAKYITIEKKVIVKEYGNEIIEPVWKRFNYTGLKSPAKVKSTPIPVEYTTIVKYKLIKAAETKKVEIPCIIEAEITPPTKSEQNNSQFIRQSH